MESPATGRYIPPESKKRVFPESSSSMEPPVNRTLKRKNKQNEGTIISSTLVGIIELDSDSDGLSDSYNRKDYMDFYANDYIYEEEEEEEEEEEDEYANLQSQFDNIDVPTGVEASLPGFFDSIKMKNKMTSAMQSNSVTCHSLRLPMAAKKVKSVKEPLKARRHKMSYASGAGSSNNSRLVDPQEIEVEVNEFVDTPENGQIIPMEDVKLDQDYGVAGSSSKLDNGDDILRKDQNFKKFDVVKDHSDHHFAAQSSSMVQPSKNWAKKIQEEWRILKKDLPDMIFVRVYESRMDLLTAVIIGAEGTPYHDGLFFFDVCFPSSYPRDPPQVHYHSGGLRINPNLYHDGKVCLSLLNTWVGRKNEKWVPGSSTMLQVLVSIQGLILNANPYFNEPALSSDSVDGEKQSLLYNERTLILSLRTMVYTMKNPPKHFEDLVIEHFRDRAHAILTACKAYCKGVRVGYVVDKGKEEGCSWGFRSDVQHCMKMLAAEFKQMGVKDMEEYMSLTKKIMAFFGF